MLTGENGIINQANNAKDKTEQARVEELVDMAVSSLIGKNRGSTNQITSEMVAEEVNEMENREDVYAEGSTFPTKIIFPEENREVDVDLTQKEDSNKIYNEDVDENQIAPTKIFDYEIINEAKIGATDFNSLPTKEVRITKIKPEYCNNDNKSSGFIDTNYEIILEDGRKIEDLLIIPYQVEGKYVENGIDGEMYKITEVNIGVYWSNETGSYTGYGLPSNIKKIIYPNTVKKITGDSSQTEKTSTISQIILPNKLEEIGDYALQGCGNLTNIDIPHSVISIGEGAFNLCGSLNNIDIPNGITSIGGYTFNNCKSLTNIKIPSSVTNIESEAFYQCDNLTTVNYTGTKSQWSSIIIGSENNALKNATIHCIDGDINP